MGRDGCPAVKTLDSALRTSIPFLNGSYKEWNGKNYPRLQTDGNPRHQMGICLDIILFCKQGLTPDKSVDWQKEKKLGENLVRAFIDLKDSMKWTEIIFQDRFFWEPEYYTHYAQDQKHFTHIHIDWMTNSLKGKGKSENEIYQNSPQNKTTEFKAALTAKLDQINEKWNNNTLDSINLAGIVKTYSPDVNPVGEWRVQCDKWTWIYQFDANGNVTWRDPYNNKSGKGKWKVGAGEIQFAWNSGTPESWKLPINPSNQTGSTKMEGKHYTINAVRM
ncbi:MAG: hypothetical protein JNJ77_11095 [Planctomycetia bacterium]|nr:hypothetical protein [Planctomycetia bacterium]